MSYKGLVFAAAALAGAFASTAAGALPASAGLGVQPAGSAAVMVDYYYSGYDYTRHHRHSGYGSIRPSFWGYPALWLPNEPKVIATADEVQWARDHQCRPRLPQLRGSGPPWPAGRLDRRGVWRGDGRFHRCCVRR